MTFVISTVNMTNYCLSLENKQNTYRAFICIVLHLKNLSIRLCILYADFAMTILKSTNFGVLLYLASNCVSSLHSQIYTSIVHYIDGRRGDAKFSSRQITAKALRNAKFYSCQNLYDLLVYITSN